LLFQVI